MGETCDDDVRWPMHVENAFLGILYERVKKDPNRAPRFKPSDWGEVDEEMFLATGKKYGSEKLTGKYHRLRIKHRLFSELLGHTGTTYDSNSNTVFASESVWEIFYKRNKSFKTFRKNGCKNYEKLDQVFNKSKATGLLSHASSQLPPTSDEELKTEEKFLDKSVHVTESDKSDGSYKGKRVVNDAFGPGYVQPRKESKFEKLDSYLEKWASSLTARVEKDLARVEMYKRGSNEVTSPIFDQYSIDRCMEVLELLEDVSDTSYIKALEKFKDPDWRKMFMKMSLIRRKSWLKSLE